MITTSVIPSPSNVCVNCSALVNPPFPPEKCFFWKGVSGVTLEPPSPGLVVTGAPNCIVFTSLLA